ncbi:MAG TPA: hypothetical protein VFM35_10365, partial [Candidatus Binatia bacterium]|nr:hypothetical protein [Candidatus Binatia bacterium]
IGKFLADLEWWFPLKGLLGVEEAQTELLRSYAEEGKPDRTMDARLARARLFHVLILVKIALRRVPIYKRGWAERTSSLIERAADVLQKTMEVKRSGG